MTTLCITGTPGRDFESASKLLFQGGLASAKPIERETTISLEDWHARVGPLLRKQQAPGRLWEQLAGDLLLANFQQPQWGWSDPATLDALEFWAELESGMCFLLLTSDPQEYLAHHLLEGSGESGEEVDEKACLQEWRYQHELMLTFYLDNPERCLLVNARQARANPSAFVEKLEERWGLELNLSSSYVPVLAGHSRQEAPITLAQYIAEKSLIDHGKGLMPLREELQAAQFPLAEPAAQSDIDGNILGSANLSLVSILRDYQQRCARDLSDSDRKALETLRRENEQLLTKLRYVQEQLDATTENQLQLEKQLAEAKALPSVTPEELANLEEQRLAENEILLLQLNQVQEELEATFNKQKDSEAANVASNEAAERARIDRDNLAQELKQLTQQSEETKQENELLLLQLNQVQDELEATFNKHQDSEAASVASNEAAERARVERDNLAQELKQLNHRLEEAKQENELLLLQLHQVQEELEYYFHNHQEISGEFVNLKTENQQLKQRLREVSQQADERRGWLARLGSKPKPTNHKLAFEGVNLRHEQVNPDYEHLWITLKDVSFGGRYAPEWQFRLSCAGVKPNEFGLQPKLEIPDQQEQLLEHWFAESESEHGQKLELRFSLPNSMDSGVWKQIPDPDQVLIRSLIHQLPDILVNLKDTGRRLSRDWDEWQELAANMLRIHKAKDRK